MAEGNINLEFVRQIEVDSTESLLNISQLSVGDVGCVVWDAGMVLGKYLDLLHSKGEIFQGKTIIDVGSGTGISGLFAAALGSHVILTDLPEVIPLLKKNIEANQVAIKGSAVAAELIWGNSVNQFPEPDIILLSDCIYYDMSVEKLVPTLAELSRPQTEILISYEDRTLGNKQQLLKMFLKAIQQSFVIEIIPHSQQHPDYQSSDIHILKCKKIA